MEYPKKSYKLLLVWLVILLVVLLLGDFILSKLEATTNITIKMIIVLLNLWMLSLLYMMYKTERIYMINGMTYEKAKSMTSEERKLFIWKHIVKFGQGALITFAYLIISYIFNWSMILDFFIGVLLIIISAFRTISIKE